MRSPGRVARVAGLMKSANHAERPNQKSLSRSEPQVRSTSDCNQWRAAVALPPATVRWAANNGWGTKPLVEAFRGCRVDGADNDGLGQNAGFRSSIWDGLKRCISRVSRLAGAGGRQGCSLACQCHEPLA